MQLLQSEITELWNEEKRQNRKNLLIAILVLILVFIVSLFFRTAAPGFVPVQAISNLFTASKLGLAQLTHNPYALQKYDIMNGQPFFLETLARLRISLVTVVSGMVLALSGSVFQTIYHNPLASPNMIGATVGVNLGNVIMINVYSTAALTMISRRYLVCYLCTIVIMTFIMFFGKITGRKGYGYSVIEMVMVGSIISHIISTFVTFRMYRMSVGDMAAYEMLDLGIYLNTTFEGIAIFLVLSIAGLIPLILMRYRVNSLSFDPGESAAGGIRPWLEQVVTQYLGILIITAALVQCGDVGIFALVVPHLVRYIVGADFRKVAVYSMVVGGIMLLICRSIASMFYVSIYGSPLSFVVALLSLPIFIVIIIQQRRGFE